MQRDIGNHEREIEILPPERDPEPPGLFGGGPVSGRIWISGGDGRARIVKLGPFGTFLLGAAALFLLGLGVFFMTGLFLIVAPIVLLLGAGAWLAGSVGIGPFRRLR